MKKFIFLISAVACALCQAFIVFCVFYCRDFYLFDIGIALASLGGIAIEAVMISRVWKNRFITEDYLIILFPWMMTFCFGAVADPTLYGGIFFTIFGIYEFAGVYAFGLHKPKKRLK